MTSVSKDTEAD